MTTITTILAAGTTAARSTDVAIEAGETVTIGLFSPTGSIPGGVECPIVRKDATGGYTRTGMQLSSVRIDGVQDLNLKIDGPITIAVDRGALDATGVAIGVLSES